MSVRAIQARVDCDRATLQHLWRTHRVFHERLPAVLAYLFKMRRGECGETPSERDLYKRIGQFITKRSAQNADYLMNAVSKADWKPTAAKSYKIRIADDNGEEVEISGAAWADEAATLTKQGRLLFDKKELTGDLPACMRQMLNREAVAIISGHDELTARWKSDHAKWRNEKELWEAEHKQYLALRPEFEKFEEAVGGKISKRRGRWDLYLQWLRENPKLAGWRGGEATVHELSDEAQKRINGAKPWKRRSAEAAEFWQANPELAALDRLHGHYERHFIRRRKGKRNTDGFDHPPTFTMPDHVLHPRWFVFNAPQTNPSGYRALQLPATARDYGTVELKLLTGDRRGEEGFPSSWMKIRFRADPRLAAFRRVKKETTVTRGENKGKSKVKDAYEFYDRHLRRWRAAEISGIKLIFRQIRVSDDGALQSAAVYLVFTCTIDDQPLTERAKEIKWSDTGELTKSGRSRKARELPKGLITCAVDLGLRHVGFATLCCLEGERPQILRARNIWMDDNRRGPDLAHIGRHKRKIKHLRRLRGKPIIGERSHVELQRHITHMAEDRFKKAARGIINFAWNVDGVEATNGEPIPRADVILIEKLEGFIPDAERERGVNRALAAWNRGQLVARLKEMAIDAGYKGRVFEIYPAGTSQVCSRCGELGRRYGISRDNSFRRPDIRFGWVEKLFACPSCGYRANSDYNASVNLHRKFLLGEHAVKAFYSWRDQSETMRRGELQKIEEGLLRPLRELHNLMEETLERLF